MEMQILDGGRDMTGCCRVDVSRGERVSSEWFNRPDDKRFLSLDDLYAQVLGWAKRSRTRTVERRVIRVEASRDNPKRLGLVLPGTEAPVAPTHWSFCQLASLVGVPAAYLREPPALLAGINLQFGLLQGVEPFALVVHGDLPPLPQHTCAFRHELIEQGRRGDPLRSKVPKILAQFAPGREDPSMVTVPKKHWPDLSCRNRALCIRIRQLDLAPSPYRRPDVGGADAFD
jgi:hypothetical protein